MKSKFLAGVENSSEEDDYEKFEMSDEDIDTLPYQKRKGPTKDQQIYGSFLDVRNTFFSNHYS
jgi:hypothetical protein